MQAIFCLDIGEHYNARLSNRRVKQEYLQTIRKVISKTRV